MKPLAVKYVLGQLTVEDILPYGIESVRIDKYALPAVVLKKRGGKILVWIDDIPVPDMPDFEMSMDARVMKIVEAEAEILLTEGLHKRLHIGLGRPPKFL